MASDPTDGRIIVPKKNGMGWTLNWSRPLAWVIVAVAIAACIGIGYINR